MCPSEIREVKTDLYVMLCIYLEMQGTVLSFFLSLFLHTLMRQLPNLIVTEDAQLTNHLSGYVNVLC